MNTNRILDVLIILFFFGLTFLPAGENKDASDLFEKAKKARIEEDWDRSISLFQELIDRYPESRYYDDAHFWIGYCLENKPGFQLEAFLMYDRLINEFPASSWTDDAHVHQIFVAESLAASGKKPYLNFLVEKLESPVAELWQNAAFGLGRLGDQRALPYLEKLVNHETFGTVAGELIAAIKMPEENKPLPSPEKRKGISFEAFSEQREPKTPEKEDENYGFLLPPSADYKLYRDMLRDDNQWSKEELIDFGMWTILPTNDFEEYHSYSEFDRAEWLRKYWKRRDPTPTSDENEAYEEFERRVLHARAQFGRLWNAKHFKYLRDQHNREGWPNAPWDARGELYIKYGEPDFSSPEDFNQEVWTYYGMGADFIVNAYMTNIYYNAVSPGPIAQVNYKDNLPWFETNFIFSKEFRYKHDYHADPLKGAEVNIIEKNDGGDSGLLIEYSVPLKEFSGDENGSNVRFMERWVVLDEDMKPCRQGKEIRLVASKAKKFSNRIPVGLPPGTYMVTLRLQDMNSDKTGIYIDTVHLSGGK